LVPSIQDRIGSSRRPPLTLVSVVVLAVAAVSTLDALAIFWTQMAQRDFGAFYSSGLAWNQSTAMYAGGRPDLPNLNPPGVVAVIFGPLARLPLRPAGILWQLLGTAALTLAAWRTARELTLRRDAAVLAVAILMATIPARYVWLEGQITWLLLVPATESWIAFRRGAFVMSGAWLGVIVAIKPFLGIAALALGIPVAATAAAISAGLTGLGVLITSVEPWQQWLALGPGISVTWPLSGSVWTLGTRAIGAAPLDVVVWTSLPWIVMGIAAVVAAAGLIAAHSLRDPDARWTVSIAVALLISPLGWIYYLPFVAPSLVAQWQGRRWSAPMTAAICLCCIPMNLYYSAIERGWLAGMTLGAAYTWTLVLILIGAMKQARSRP
jgi:hypothetical protein